MKKILIVDDQPDLLRLLETLLRGVDRQVWLAENGDKAIDIVREVLPDVILLDVMMPGGINGYEVARTVKQDPATAGCAIIIMTAKVQQQDREDAFAAGADDYIGKPFDIADLQRKVEKFLARTPARPA